MANYWPLGQEELLTLSAQSNQVATVQGRG